MPVQTANYSDDAQQTNNKSSALRQTSFAGIVSECIEMHRVFQVIEKVARIDSTVLILGESGTGKELVARAVHKQSGRQGKLVPVNCAAIPEEILESELFGHEKGAFTGATASKIGRFQMAHNGTIFLDEIAEMSPKLQAKLLRVIQERKVEPVGATRFHDVNVRIIAATNKDLKKEVQAGRFREDLFYRLQVVPVELPPLRDRGNDIRILARHFAERASEKIGCEPRYFSDSAERLLASYDWPGNVRELENLTERLVILGDDECLDDADLPDYIRKEAATTSILETQASIPPEGLDFNELVNDFEVRLISLALEKTNWNKKAAAELLRLNRTTLVEKIKKKGLAQNIEVLVEDDARFSSTSEYAALCDA